MPRLELPDLLGAVGALCVIGGIAAWSWRLALIVVGLSAIALAIRLARAEGRHP